MISVFYTCIVKYSTLIHVTQQKRLLLNGTAGYVKGQMTNCPVVIRDSS